MHICTQRGSTKKRVFFVVRCGDPRPHAAILDYIDSQLPHLHGALPVDIALPGMIGMFVAEPFASLIDGIRNKVESMMDNEAVIPVMLVVGHDNCLGHPVCGVQHRADTRTAAAFIAQWGLPLTIHVLYAAQDGVRWSIEELDRGMHLEDCDGLADAASA